MCELTSRQLASNYSVAKIATTIRNGDMSAATVTYHELPPVSSWASGQQANDAAAHGFCQVYGNGHEPPRYETLAPVAWQTQLGEYYDGDGKF